MFDVESRVEVDALALMLDGASGDLYRFGRVSVEILEWGTSASGNRPGMVRAVEHPEWAEVAEAILQLEGFVDWRPSRDDVLGRDPIACGALAGAALDEAEERNHHLEWWDEMFLEAAALLRDGWRPRKRSKR